MSGGRGCACRDLRLCDRKRYWRVTMYRANMSAFNGYHRTPSRYSEVTCQRCGVRWRTGAAYVERLIVENRETEGAR